MDNIQPPKWLDRFLEFYCHKSKLEDLQGDLWEFYERNHKKKGKRLANIIYFIDVLKFIRIYTVQKPKLNTRMNFLALFNNYVKTSIRSIARNRLFSGINIVGLAISMSVCLLMIAFISEVSKFDTFYENKDRIYRVVSTFQDNDDDLVIASVPATLNEELAKYPNFDGIAQIRRHFEPDVFLETEEVFQLKGHYATNDFFKVLPFDVIKGNIENVLAEPYNLVVTEKTAEKLFKDQDAINKVVKIDDESYTIRAIVADPPKQSYIQFELICSFITHQDAVVKEDSDYYSEWTNMWMYHTFVLLKEGQTKESLDQVIKEIETAKNKEVTYGKVLLGTQNIQDIVPGKVLSNEMGVTMDSKIIWIVTLLSLVVILSASFNYMNLSIAKSLRRAKEIGVRKVVGASQWNVFLQFIMEAVVIALIALFIAFGLYLMIKPQFLNLREGINNITDLDLTVVQFLLFLAFAIVIGIVSGFIPSLLLSRLKAMLVLKDYTKTKLLSLVSFRKVLVVIQFTISLAFILSSTIIYQQYKYALNFDYGFNTDNILNIEMIDTDQAKQYSELLKKIPEVSMISKSQMVPSVGSVFMTEVKTLEPLDSIDVYYNCVDVNYLENFGHNLLAGNNFPDRANKENEIHIIVNESLIKRLKLGTPSEAIGKVVNSDEETYEIIGVVEDYLYTTIEGEVGPMMFRNSEVYHYVNATIKSEDLVGTFDKLEKAWKEVDPIHPFSAEFYDVEIEKAYSKYIMMFKIVSFLSVIAVSISVLGLLGMAVYTTETRIKEISIRKVLGATEKSLVYLLSKGFFWMLIIATFIAIPATYTFFNEVYFLDFKNHIDIGPGELLFGVIIMFGIGLLVIGWQTIAAARSNPADNLRDE